MTLVKEQFAKTFIPDADVFAFTWTVTNYELLQESMGINECVESPPFVLYNQSCYIRLYPNGSNKDGCSRIHTSAFMHFEKIKEKIGEQSNVPAKAKGYFYIINKLGQKLLRHSKKILILNANSEWCIEIMRNSDIMDPKYNLLTGDSIKLRLEFKIFYKETHMNCYSIINSSADIKQLISKMEKLFCQTELSDVKFVTSDCKEIPAHKIILVAHVPYFEKMFQSNMKESTCNTIKVADIKFDVFKELLRFIYTGKVENIDAVASELIKAADKYGIEYLKFKCAENLCKAMTIENVIDTLEVADSSNADNLKK